MHDWYLPAYLMRACVLCFISGNLLKALPSPPPTLEELHAANNDLGRLPKACWDHPALAVLDVRVAKTMHGPRFTYVFEYSARAFGAEG